MREIAAPSGLAALEREWAQLRSSLPSPAHSLPWLEAAAAAFPPPLDVLVLEDRGLAAAAPLAAVRGGRESIGVRQLGEPSDLLWRDAEALDVLASELARRRIPLVLRRVPTGSPTIAALRAAYGRRGAVVLERGTGATPVIELDERWAEPESNLGRRHRSDLRRADRRARALGAVEVEVLAPTPEQVTGVLDEAFAVEVRSWKGRSGTALSLDRLRLPFYRRYAATAARRGDLLVAFLRIDGRAVAMQLDVRHAGSLWLLKIGYDESYAHCSPGHLLLLEVIRHCAQSGYETVEFFGSAAPWTRRWTTHEREMSALGCFPTRPASALPAVEHLARQLHAWHRDRR